MPPKCNRASETHKTSATSFADWTMSLYAFSEPFPEKELGNIPRGVSCGSTGSFAVCRASAASNQSRRITSRSDSGTSVGTFVSCITCSAEATRSGKCSRSALVCSCKRGRIECIMDATILSPIDFGRNYRPTTSHSNLSKKSKSGWHTSPPTFRAIAFQLAARDSAV